MAPDDKGGLPAACQNLSRALDAFNSAVRSQLGVRHIDLDVLGALGNGPLGLEAIAQRVGRPDTAVTHSVTRLQATQLVRSSFASSDPDTTLIALTPEAWADLYQLYQPLRRRLGVTAERLAADTYRQVIDVIEAMTAMVMQLQRELQDG